MHTYNPRVLKNLLKQMKPYIVEDSFDIPVWKTYTGKHIGGGVTVTDGEPATEMKLGDRYNIGYNETRYFEADIVVPEHYGNRKTYFHIDFGGEGLVRINGKIIGAISSRANSGWVGREILIVPTPFGAGESLHIQIEHAVDSAAFCDSAIAGAKYMNYELAHASFDLINADAESLCFDVDNAMAVYEKTEDKYVAKRIYNAIDTAVHKLAFDYGKQAYYDTVPVAAASLKADLEKINFATPGKVLLAGHSHLDVAWLWTVDEIHRKCARTFSNNLALMDAYPDFRFCQSQAVLYDFVKNDYPDIYARIKEKVAAGQWEIVGSAWVEADTNIASGESLIRQLLFGRNFFKKEFGFASDVYWLPDCFGFTAALPQIIKKSGMKYFITSKLQYNDTNEFPVSAFKWRSHSGDEVLAFMQKVPYGSEADADYVMRTRSTNNQNDILDASIGMFGYGDGGGGCTYNMVENVRRLSNLPGVPETKMSFARDFFDYLEEAKDELPVWDGEMYYENHRGTFTSQAFVKKNNRKGEFGLRNAELLGVFAGTYDAEKLAENWKLLLVNQFHDILPGTSIHEVFVNTRKEYEQLTEGYKSMISTAASKLATAFGTGDNSIVVFNTNATPSTGLISFNTSAGSGINGIVTADGEKVISTAVTKDNVTKIEFIAENVPPVGYRVYRFSNVACDERAVVANEHLLENEYLRVEFDDNGIITSIYDKENKREVLCGEGNLLSIGHDKPIHESAWNLENDYKMNRIYLRKAEKISVTEASAVKGTISIVRKFNESEIRQKITLKAGARTLDFSTCVDWRETEKILKTEFPVTIRSRYSTFEIAHGATERPTYANNPYEKAMFECCAHKWTDLSESDYGVSLMNDCKYGYNIDDNVMCLTLLRAPIVPDKTGDKEVHNFTYSLYPHAGGYAEADTVAKALSLNNPLFAEFAAKGNGDSTEKSLIKPNCTNIVLDALKIAEDGNGIILRVYESARRHSKVRLDLALGIDSVCECNLMEEGCTPVDYDEKGFTFDIAPYEVKTFRIATL